MEKLSDYRAISTPRLLAFIADPIKTREGIWRMAYNVVKSRMPDIGDDHQAIRYARQELGLCPDTYSKPQKKK